MKKKNNRKVEPRDAIGLRLQKVVLLICIKKQSAAEQMHKYNLRVDCCNNRIRIAAVVVAQITKMHPSICIYYCIFIWDFTPCIFKIFSSTQYSKASELLKHRFVSNLIIVTGTDLAVDGGYGALGPEGIGESSKFAGTEYQNAFENHQQKCLISKVVKSIFNSDFPNL